MKITREQLKKFGACDEFCDAMQEEYPFPLTTSTAFNSFNLEKATGGELGFVYKALAHLSSELQEASDTNLADDFAVAAVTRNCINYFNKLYKLIEQTPCPEHAILFPGIPIDLGE